MIYIDPPYNTGKEFIYPDNFQDNLDTYLKYTGQTDEVGRKFSINSDTSGRYHTNWLNMMYPRLKLARNLLRDDGVIFISIDDNERTNLQKLCDEVFGEENYLVTFYTQVRYPGKTLAEKNDYQKLIENVLVYQKIDFTPKKKVENYSLDKFCWEINELSPGKKVTLGKRDVEIFCPENYEIKKVPSSIDALKETWATGTVLKSNASGKYFVNYLAPRKNEDGLRVLYKVHGIGEDGIRYRYFTGPQKANATSGKFFSGVPSVKRKEIESGISLKEKPISNFYNFADSFGNCRHEGSIDFRGGKKPIAFLNTFLEQSLSKDGNEIVLDFFAGSGSIAHTVYEKNFKSKKDSRFILVQLPEKINEQEKDIASEFDTIADLSKERIRRAAKKIKEENPDYRGDLGFKVFKLDSSNIKRWEADFDTLKQDLLNAVDCIKQDRSSEDVLHELLLKYGLDLTVPIETRAIAGKTVYSIGLGALVACLEKDVSMDVVNGIGALKEELRPEIMRVVFKDDGFKDDVVKTNALQTLKRYDIEDIKSL